ncbi:cytochrome b [Palleronia caenipelagi]|uniref:Cytochrome b n=1 Tax=Palleronia caenipelagi TaxID=2489174 RepID=A0A547Q2T1_9RHOB|nr:cytochrome b [Palleronia caenipelagi]TRD20671.1 cytochrome b [Palleronia caenipelagi]
MSQRTGYTTAQIAMHWLVAATILLTWFFGEGMGKLLKTRAEGGEVPTVPLHAALGMTVLALVVIRLVIRLRTGHPDAVPGTSDAVAKARDWGHIALYVLMIGVPIGGMAAWFGNIGAAQEGHEVGVKILVVLILGHAALALYHQYVKKDGTLLRMMRPED